MLEKPRPGYNNHLYDEHGSKHSSQDILELYYVTFLSQPILYLNTKIIWILSCVPLLA